MIKIENSTGANYELTPLEHGVNVNVSKTEAAVNGNPPNSMMVSNKSGNQHFVVGAKKGVNVIKMPRRHTAHGSLPAAAAAGGSR